MTSKLIDTGEVQGFDVLPEFEQKNRTAQGETTSSFNLTFFSFGFIFELYCMIAIVTNVDR